MQLTDQFNFGKYKGQTLQQVLSTTEGTGWLKWLVSQPPTNPKFAKVNNARNEVIKKHLGI